MKIGILSDSHGKADRLRAALNVLVENKVETIVHCGDIGSRKFMEMLAATGVPVYLVGGNMDKYVIRLEASAKDHGIHFDWDRLEVPIGDGRYLVVTHGHKGHILEELVLGGQFPYVCHGHTHVARDQRVGQVRVINPGALHHCPRHTVAVLDTESDEVEFIEVP